MRRMSACSHCQRLCKEYSTREMEREIAYKWARNREPECELEEKHLLIQVSKDVEFELSREAVIFRGEVEGALERTIYDAGNRF